MFDISLELSTKTIKRLYYYSVADVTAPMNRLYNSLSISPNANRLSKVSFLDFKSFKRFQTLNNIFQLIFKLI